MVDKGISVSSSIVLQKSGLILLELMEINKNLVKQPNTIEPCDF
jgi:hypothetical protein